MDVKMKRSRRSRSQRDRRRRDGIDNVQNRSLSSGSERGQSHLRNKALRNYGKCTNLHPDRPPRPPRRKRRGSVCQEEDIIDGFAIVSFLSLDNVELALRKRTKSLRSQEGKEETWERQVLRGVKTERALVTVNGFPDNGADVDLEKEVEKERGKLKPGSKKNKQGSDRRQSRAQEVTRVLSKPPRRSSRDRHSESSFSGRGYSCDSEYDIDDKVSGVESDKLFTLTIKSVSTDCAADPKEPVEVCSSSRVSGLQRSQEQSSDTPFSVPTPSHTSTPQLTGSPASKAAPISTQTTPSPPPPVCVKKERSSPRVATTPTLQTPPTLQGHVQIKREPQVTSSHPQSRSLYPGIHNSYSSSIEGSRKRTHPQSPQFGRNSSPSPALPLAVSEAPGPNYFLPSPSHRRPAMFASPLSLPTNSIVGHPAGTGYSAEHDLLRQELNNRFLAQSMERGPNPAPHLRPEFHQHTHQHQHQHQHTHQHTFTPFSPIGPPPGLLAAPSAPSMGRTATHNLEKYPVKLENPYSNFMPSYPPAMPGMSGLLPQVGPFSRSPHGAFQPKANPIDVATRPSEIPRSHPRMMDPFRASSRKAGRWCAMHSQIAWQIHHHQQRIRHMRVDPHKLNMKLDLFSRPAGPGLRPGLPYSHDLTRPLLPSGHLPASPFSGPYHHPHYLSTSHLPDPFSRPSNYGGLVNMASNAFMGLGAPSSSPFVGRQGHGLPGFGGPPQESWNRLHRTPPSFPTPPPLSRPADVDRKPAVMMNTERERDAKKFTSTKESSDRDRTSQERNPPPTHPSSSSYQISSLIGNSAPKGSSPDHGHNREAMLPARVQIKQSSSPGPEMRERRATDPTTAKSQSTTEALCPPRGPVNIKQERRDEMELTAGTSNMTLLHPSGPPHLHSQVLHPSRRNTFPTAGVFQGSHLPHSLPLSMGPLHPVSSLSALERARVQPFMGVSPLGVIRESVASHLSTPWEPLPAPYRELYQQSQQPHNLDPARGHRQRDQHPQDRHRQAEERARLHQLQGSPMEGHLAHTSTFMSSLGGVMYPRLSPSAPHSGHLNRTPPAATLSIPPPLVPVATSQPAVPRRTAPTSGRTASGELAPSCTPKEVEAQ